MGRVIGCEDGRVSADNRHVGEGFVFALLNFF